MQIELKNVTYIYNANTVFSKTAVDDISISIEKGEFVGIIGHTGSGKSTLVKHLNGLMKPTSGVVMIDGVDINADKSKLKRYRQKVGLIFQYPEHQLFEMTVMKDVSFGPKNMGFSDAEVRERAVRALAWTGIGEADFEKSPFELSGGQKRRVAIAGVLAMEPDVLVLDEPTAGLDPRGRDEILGNIKMFQTELKKTVILVSHSMEDISRLSGRVIVLNQGKVAMDGTCREVFKEAERLEAMGLSVPMVCHVLDKLRAKGYELDHVYTTKDAAKEIFKLYQGIMKQGGV